MDADDSSKLLTGSGDASAGLWNMQNGDEIFRFKFREPCRAVKFSVGEQMAALSTDPFMSTVSAIRLVNIAEDKSEQTDEVVQSFTGPRGRIARVEWLDNNRVLLSASEDGFLRRWDVEVGCCRGPTVHIASTCMGKGGTAWMLQSSQRQRAGVVEGALLVLQPCSVKRGNQVD